MEDIANHALYEDVGKARLLDQPGTVCAPFLIPAIHISDAGGHGEGKSIGVQIIGWSDYPFGVTTRADALESNLMLWSTSP